MQVSTYSPAIFQVDSIQKAKNIILTPEVGLTTDERWEKETPYLTKLIDNHIAIDESSRVLDFGGGIGRMCRALYEEHKCQTTVLDIAVTMRALAHIYVNNPKFFSISPENTTHFDGQFDVVIAIWALQHVFNMDEELERIEKLLKPGGKLFVVNERRRFVPTVDGWIDDSVDIFIALQCRFDTQVIDIMDAEVVTDVVSKRTFWGVFSKKPINN